MALVRPLLSFRRCQLAQLCAQQGLRPVEDPTNASLQYLRNVFRHLMQVNGCTITIHHLSLTEV